MSAKYNINKIHGDFLNTFDTVKIEEKSNHEFGNYFEISVGMNESVIVKIILETKKIESNTFEWKYFSNPLDIKSNLVERKSTIDTISSDVNDIILKKRFNSEYIDILDNSKNKN